MSVANKFLKPTVIAATSVGLLYRDLVVARTVWTDAINPGEFTGALNDTVTMRVPARRTARTRTLRAGTAIVNDVSNEFGVPVVLDTDVYNGAPITDEELTLDIADFGAQVLQPQTRAVAEGVEAQIVAEIEGASYGSQVIDPTDAAYVVSGKTDWYITATHARRMLNDKNVPRSDRTLLIGSDVEEQILNTDRFTRFDAIGAESTDALRESIIGRIAGFNVIASSEIDPDAAYAYHRTAFVLATRAPKVPQGATFAQQRALGGNGGAPSYVDGISCRWLMDYDYTNTTDRSLVNTWVGTATVTDPTTPSNPASGSTLMRAVKIIEGS
jgi:hypothetical protein